MKKTAAAIFLTLVLAIGSGSTGAVAKKGLDWEKAPQSHSKVVDAKKGLDWEKKPPNGGKRPPNG